MLTDAATVQAVHTADRNLQLDTRIEQIAIPYMADTPIMDQRAWCKTATTARQLGCERLESQREDVFDVLMAGNDGVAWPESGKIDRMHDDSRAQGLVCLVTANLPEFLTVNYLFPAIMRRT